MYFRCEKDIFKPSVVTFRESAVWCEAVSRRRVIYSLGAERGGPLTVRRGRYFSVN